MSIYKLKLGFQGFLMVLDVPKSLGAGPHQNMMFWALKMKS